MAVQLTRHKFTVEEYHRMAEVGLLGEDDRIELLDGEIVDMSPVGAQHAACVKRLGKLLSRVIGDDAMLGVQDPVRLDDTTEPIPDVSILKTRSDFYASSHPTPADVLLLIEVADSTLPVDRRVKVPLYARAGIPEVWVVNLQQETVEVYSQPGGGAYKVVSTAQRGQAIPLSGFAGVEIHVDDVLG
jgi:Uma2 family endonuclease